MGIVRFDQIARECRETYKGSLEGKPIVGLEHIEPYDMLLKNYDVDVETTFTKSFKKGKILFGRRRAYQHKACVATCDGICSGDITVIEPIEGAVYPDLLPFIIQNDDFFEHAIIGSNGALSPRVKWEHMANFELNLPSIDGQKVLAEKLWAAYEVKQSYLKMIDATDEMVKAQFMKMFDFKDLNLLSPSNDFEIKCFDDTSNSTKIPASDYQDKGLYAIFDQSQDNYIAGYTNLEEGLCKNIPAVLFGDHSRVIKYIDEPFFIGADGVKIIRPKDKSLLPEFLYYDLKYHNIPNTGYNRHFKYIKMIYLTKASLDDQNIFVTIAHQADKSKAELRKSIDAIDKVIKSLINENL